MEETSIEKFKVLIIEDSPDCAALLNHILLEAKIFGEIKIFMTGEEALGYLERQSTGKNFAGMPDIIFLDLNLPGEHGLKILSKIKNDSALVSIPVVVMTASEDRHDWSESYRQGGMFFIPKPLDRTLLSENLFHMKITGVLKKRSEKEKT